jgi:hypothetical protein
MIYIYSVLVTGRKTEMVNKVVHYMKKDQALGASLDSKWIQNHSSRVRAPRQRLIPDPQRLNQ